MSYNFDREFQSLAWLLDWENTLSGWNGRPIPFKSIKTISLILKQAGDNDERRRWMLVLTDRRSAQDCHAFLSVRSLATWKQCKSTHEKNVLKFSSRRCFKSIWASHPEALLKDFLCMHYICTSIFLAIVRIR